MLVQVYSAEIEVLVAETVTDPEGRFVFRESGLEEGTYRVRFSDTDWWEDADSWADATDVHVVAGSVDEIDASIIPSFGSIHGVASDGEAPIAGATIEALSRVDGSVIGSGPSGDDGTFSIGPVPTGDYRIKAKSPGFATTFYPASATATGATLVSVGADEDVTGVDIVLPVEASLTGIVEAGGAPRPGVTVAAATLSPHAVHALTVTGPDGRFSLSGLSPTGYLLMLTDTSGGSRSVTVGAVPGDADSGIVYPLSPGGRVDVGAIDLVTGGTNTPVVTTTELPQAFVGLPVLAPLDAVGGAGGYFWDATGLPPGLEIDPAQGVITGTPTEAVTSEVMVTVADARGGVGEATLSLPVVAGMPEACVVDDCAFADRGSRTLELPADVVGDVTRDAEGVVVELTLAPDAPPVAVGQILVIAPGELTPEGLIVESAGVQDAGGGTTKVTVAPATLADAYESALIKSTGAPVEAELSAAVVEPEADEAGAGDATAATPRSGEGDVPTSAGTGLADRPEGVPPEPMGTASVAAAAAGPCGATAEVEVSPDVDLDVDPMVSVLYGRNLFGFGNIFVGTGGLKLFQVNLDTTLTVRLTGQVSGKVHCDIPLPSARAVVPAGPAGAFTFRLTPGLSLDASAAIRVDTSVTVHCGFMYRWSDGHESTLRWCRPTATAPSASGSGADLTVGGSITATATLDEIVGLSGRIDAKLHAGYRPLQRPRGQLDGKITANITGCLLCILGVGPRFTLAEGTLYERVFATWGDEPTPPSCANRPGGCGGGGDVLLYGYEVEDGDLGAVTAVLAAAGHRVGVAEDLPDDLSGYDQVWTFTTYQAMPDDVVSRLVDYVRGGGALYVNSEHGCCPGANGSVQSLVNQLVVGGGIEVVTDCADPCASAATNAFATSAVGRIGSRPNTNVTLQTDASGWFVGVAGANVLMRSASGLVTGAAWDGPSLVGGTGRLVTVADSNWTDQSRLSPFGNERALENIAAFLAA